MVVTVLLMTGTVLSAISIVPYIKSIVRGKAKPRIVSWVIWTLLLGLTAVVSWQEHQLSSAVLSTASTIGCLIVVLLTLRHTRWGMTRLERYTLLGAGVGVAFWLMFDSPMLVLLTAVTVDAIAYIPTYVNGWHKPYHESMSMFGLSTFGSGLVLLAAILNHAAMQGLIYPIYSVMFSGIMVAILLLRRQKRVYVPQEAVAGAL